MKKMRKIGQDTSQISKSSGSNLSLLIIHNSLIRNYFTYILRCADDTLYTGYTTDIAKRIETHNAGKGAKYTRGRLPVKLIYSESFETESGAKKREYSIKSLTRPEKLDLIKNNPLS